MTRRGVAAREVAFTGAAAAFVAFAVWGSLFPFEFHLVPAGEALRLFWLPWLRGPATWSISDLVSNVLLFKNALPVKLRNRMLPSPETAVSPSVSVRYVVPFFAVTPTVELLSVKLPTLMPRMPSESAAWVPKSDWKVNGTVFA